MSWYGIAFVAFLVLWLHHNMSCLQRQILELKKKIEKERV